MDSHENPGINPGNGPATWEQGQKPEAPPEAVKAPPQDFASSPPVEGGTDATEGAAKP
jgi:hypothetical protein